MSLTILLYGYICKVETLRAAASASLTDSVLLVVPGSSLELYQASTVHDRIYTQPKGEIFKAVVAVMTRAAEKRL